MRIFKNCKDLEHEILRDVFVRGTVHFDPTWQGMIVNEKDFKKKELLCYQYALKDTSDIEEAIAEFANELQKPNKTEWAKAWAKDRIECRDLTQPSAILDKEYWDKLREADGSFAYTYEERMIYLPHIIRALKKNRYMTGAVLTIYETTRDLSNIGKRRVPCSMYYHFVVRHDGVEDKLHLIYSMRSCDLANHFFYDVYCAVALQKYVAEQLGVKIGTFYHTIGSLHIFIKDVPEQYRW